MYWKNTCILFALLEIKNIMNLWEFFAFGEMTCFCVCFVDTELESVKALFTEKEKELVMAVAKVEELTRQLERIRHDRSSAKNGTQSAAALELDKLRKELMVSSLWELKYLMQYYLHYYI